MWCAVTATVHFSAAVVFFQSASLIFSRRAVASCTLASNCLAYASPLAPMVSSLVCASLYRRTERLEIDGFDNRPPSPSHEISSRRARPPRPPSSMHGGRTGSSPHLIVERGGSKSTDQTKSCHRMAEGFGARQVWPVSSSSSPCRGLHLAISARPRGATREPLRARDRQGMRDSEFPKGDARARASVIVAGLEARELGGRRMVAKSSDASRPPLAGRGCS